MEFSGAVQALNKNRAFKRVSQAMRPENVAGWKKALLWFADPRNHAFLKNWRDDLGGIFWTARLNTH